MTQDNKVTVENNPLKEIEIKKLSEEQKEGPKEVSEAPAEIKLNQEEKILEEGSVLPKSPTVPKKKLLPKQRPKYKPKPKPQLQIPEAPKKWEDKWVNVNGEKVLFIPSSFEIMTKNGWRPIMTRADKIQK